MPGPPIRSRDEPPPPPVVLTIAGSDPSGGAGIQADLKTFHAFGVYGAAALTSVTVQNTMGVFGRHDIPADVVVAQVAAVQDDLEVAAAKTGLLADVAQIEALAAHLGRRPLAHLVVDPVLVATTGQALTTAGTGAVLVRALFPLAALVTPNLPEASALLGRAVTDVAGMRDAARALCDLGARAALVKGGHLPAGPAVDVLAADGRLVELESARVSIGPTHGTGCSLSAAIAAGLASGSPLVESVERAKRWLARALAAAPPMGRGSRPLDHRVRPDDR